MPFSITDFEQYRDEWLTYWRGLGSVDVNGNFIPPVTYREAMLMPSKKLRVFMALDGELVKLAKQKGNKNA